jgi:hypothetical protein
MSKLELPIEDYKVNGHDYVHNVLIANVDHNKRYGGVTLNLSLAKRDVMFVGFMLMQSPSEFKQIVPMDKNFKAKVQKAREAAFYQIERKTGQAWDLVQEFLKTTGAKLKEPAAEPALA